jgi:hypothetical protein
MKCSLCGIEFDEKKAQAACSGCNLVKKCELIRCPNCNFEMVPEPEWIKKLKDRRGKKNAVDR